MRESRSSFGVEPCAWVAGECGFRRRRSAIRREAADRPARIELRRTGGGCAPFPIGEPVAPRGSPAMPAESWRMLELKHESL